MKIVIGYDGSASADAAVNEVLNRTWPAGTEVRIVTAVPVYRTVLPGEGLAFYSPVWGRTVAAAREQAGRRIDQVIERFGARPDLRTSSELRDEAPAVALLEVVRQWGADLLVLGSQGMSALERLFIGSVCHAMVSNAPCTVEVVRLPLAAA